MLSGYEEKLKEHKKIKIGAWVRFYHDGHLVISEVRFIVKRVGGYVYFVTDICEVSYDSITDYRNDV